MPTLTVEMYKGGTWQSLSASSARMRRRMGTAEASFVLPDATVQNRKDLRQGREVRISMDRGDGNVVRFAGYVHKPKVEADGPKHFRMEVECVGLEYRATQEMVSNKVYPDELESENNQEWQVDSAGKDAYVREDQPTTNYGSATLLHIMGSNTGARRRALVEYPLPLGTTIPWGSRIVEAKLKVYVHQANPPYGAATNVKLHAITQDWAEGTVTWNTQPSYEADVSATAFLDETAPGWYEFDITSLVQRYADQELTNYGFLLEDDEGPAADIDVRSKEYAGAYGARVEITWVKPVKYVDAVRDLWADAWPAIDRGLVVPLRTTLATGASQGQNQITVNSEAGFQVGDYIVIDEDTASEEVRQIQSLDGGSGPMYTWTLTSNLQYDHDVGDVVEEWFGEKAKSFAAQEEFDYVNLAQATNRLLEFLDGYAWWLEWDGSLYRLRCEPKGNEPTGKTIDESEIGARFQMQPSNPDVRNVAYVMAGSLDDQGNKIVGYAYDSASGAQFGWRTVVVRDAGIQAGARANDKAEAALMDKKWEYFELAVSIDDYALRPGDRVTLSLPTVGINGVDFPDQYAVAETQDVFERGRMSRQVTLREITGEL